MASTLTSLLVHFIFSTKHREPLITPEIEPELYAYIGGVCNSNGSRLLDAGGTSDHVHLLVSLGKTISVAELMLQVKRDSSTWTKSKGSQHWDFGWQDGYAAFTIGQSQVEALRTYFARQKEHHRTVSFRDELIELLEKYKVPFEERYLE